MTQYSGIQIKQICESKLRIEFRRGRGSHHSGWYVKDGRRLKRITVPNTRKDIPPGTFGSMARQLGLTREQFEGLLDCVIDEDAYNSLIRL